MTRTKTMNKKTVSIIASIIGLALTVFGFMTSDETKYPTVSKFSAWITIAGVAILTLGVFTLFPKINPITAIASE
jgi:hypothetical protein